MKLTMKIKITKKSQIRKFKPFALTVQHFKNIMYLIANYYDSQNIFLPKFLLDKVELEKIIRGTKDIPEDVLDEVKKYIEE